MTGDLAALRRGNWQRGKSAIRWTTLFPGAAAG